MEPKETQQMSITDNEADTLTMSANESLAEGSIRSNIDTLISQEHMDIDLLKDDIDKLKGIIKLLDKEIKQMRGLIKPKSKISADRILSGNVPKVVTAEDKKMYKIKIGLFSNEKIYAQSALFILKEKFKKIFKVKSDDIRLKTLRTRSHSKDYLRRNRKSIANRLQNTLKKVGKSKKNEIIQLKEAAGIQTKQGKQTFNQLMSNFLNTNDYELNVICSGIYEIKEDIYEEARKILVNLDDSKPKKNSLTYPVLEGN